MARDPLAHLQKLGGVLDRMPAFLLIRAWKETAGPALLKHTQFMGVHEDARGRFELRIEVHDAVWHQELSFQKEEILKRFAQALTRLGYPRDRQPTSCSLTHAPAVPLSSLQSKHRRDKSRI